jgi:hypothetical protein
MEIDMNTKERITELLLSTQRDGIEKMVEWLVDEGFFESPASTRFHGAYPGGLADHSLAVYELMMEFNERLDVCTSLSPGQKPLPTEEENIIIACLLHDICKAGAYIPTPDGKNPYRWNEAQPKGHATLSILRIKHYIDLVPIEELMIRYHMGVYGLNEFYEKGSWKYKTSAEYPLRGDHSNDEDMTKEESQKARYGKSLRNAWYHNPIVKVMYFCDELATLEEKAKDGD